MDAGGDQARGGPTAAAAGLCRSVQRSAGEGREKRAEARRRCGAAGGADLRPADGVVCAGSRGLRACRSAPVFWPVRLQVLTTGAGEVIGPAIGGAVAIFVTASVA